jgi:hypothetical protein
MTNQDPGPSRWDWASVMMLTLVFVLLITAIIWKY